MFTNPPGYPVRGQGNVSQPLFPLPGASQGYMSQAIATGAIETAQDEQVIVTRLLLTGSTVPQKSQTQLDSNEQRYRYLQRTPSSSEENTHMRLGMGFPLFVRPTPLNGTTQAASLYDVNFQLYNNRESDAFRCGQLLEREYTYMGVLSTTLDPTHNLMHRNAPGILDAYRQGPVVPANVVAFGPTPGVVPVAFDAMSTFGGECGAKITPRPCAPHVSGARAFLVLMPVKVAWMEGYDEDPIPTPEQLETFVSEDCPLANIDLCTREIDRDHFTRIPSVIGDLSADDTYVPPIRSGSASKSDCCYAFVPYMTSDTKMPSPDQFRSYGGPRAPRVKVIPAYRTSVDDPAPHGCTHGIVGLSRSQLHPTECPVSAVTSSTVQALVCM